MPALSIYIWKHVWAPFKRYCKDKGVLKSSVINEMLSERLHKEGYI